VNESHGTEQYIHMKSVDDEIEFVESTMPKKDDASCHAEEESQSPPRSGDEGLYDANPEIPLQANNEGNHELTDGDDINNFETNTDKDDIASDGVCDTTYRQRPADIDSQQILRSMHGDGIQRKNSSSSSGSVSSSILTDDGFVTPKEHFDGDPGVSYKYHYYTSSVHDID